VSSLARELKDKAIELCSDGDEAAERGGEERSLTSKLGLFEESRVETWDSLADLFEIGGSGWVCQREDRMNERTNPKRLIPGTNSSLVMQPGF
jgi:hypothetical protein